MISNSSGKLGRFFRGWSDGTVVRRRGPGRREREGVGGRTGAAWRNAGPVGDRGNAQPGEPQRAGWSAPMPPSVRSGRVLGARSPLRAGEPPPAARLLPASLAQDCGGTRPARRRNRNRAVIHPLPARRQEPRLPAPRPNQVCDRAKILESLPTCEEKLIMTTVSTVSTVS